MTSNPDFTVKTLFDAEFLRNGTRYRHSYNGPNKWSQCCVTQVVWTTSWEHLTGTCRTRRRCGVL